jgi:uncharacterized protein
MSNVNRREFLVFLGAGYAALATGCQILGTKNSSSATILNFDRLGWTPLPPSDSDQVLLADGLNSQIIAKWKDPIGTNLKFGSHNDFTQFISLTESNDEGLLWVNHEYLNPLFSSGWKKTKTDPRTKAQVDVEMKDVGGSILHLKKQNGHWAVIPNSPHNARFDANTEFKIISDEPIDGARNAYGTLANCAGGLTPWKSFLTCEENFDMFFGDLILENGKYKKVKSGKDFMWSKFYPRSPLHYGWVVEINPLTKKGKKLTALGRFSHEGATCILAKDGRTVVYMGDDSANECIYKFISDQPNSLEKGILYVANTEQGRWLPLTMDSHPDFVTTFKSQTELLINTRIAAKIIGGTPQDRPEDIEIHPTNKDIIVALTNNKKAGRPHGSLLKISEKDGDFLSTEFSATTWISGGENDVLSCPDNMVFDKNGNLWVTSDRSDDEMNQGIYKSHKNNGLYYIPMRGEFAGQVFQVASAPTDAEFTGPSFSPDGNTLFLCVQHPGDQSKNLDELTSTWPDGIINGQAQMPKSAVMAIQGPLLEKLVSS